MNLKMFLFYGNDSNVNISTSFQNILNNNDSDKPHIPLTIHLSVLPDQRLYD